MTSFTIKNGRVVYHDTYQLLSKEEAKKWYALEMKDHMYWLVECKTVCIYTVRTPDTKAWIGYHVGQGTDRAYARKQATGGARNYSASPDFKDMQITVTCDVLCFGKIRRWTNATYLNGVRIK